MSTPQWSFDQGRQTWYYWSATEDCYIYADGTRLRRDGTPYAAGATAGITGGNIGTPAAMQQTNAPRSPYTQSIAGGLAGSLANITLGNPMALHTGQYPSSTQTSAQDIQARTHQYQGTAYGSPPTVNNYTTQPLQYRPAYRTSGVTGLQQPNRSSSGTTQSSYRHPSSALSPTSAVPEGIEVGPSERITDPNLYAHGIKAHRRFNGPTLNAGLDPSYKVRTPSHKFFTLGRVFKTPWPEPAGAAAAGVSEATGSTKWQVTGRYGQIIYHKIRWFVVIRQGQTSSTCLPINTYGGQGVAKPGVVKSEHCIIYTGKRAPQPHPNELPKLPSEAGMQDPIRVVQNKPEDKLDSFSRLNFTKLYTIEGNIKVYNFGIIHENDLPRFASQFNAIWSTQISPRRTITQPTEEEEEEDDEEEDDEADNGQQQG